MDSQQSAFEAAFGPDTREPHRTDALRIIGAGDDPRWADALDAMIAAVAAARRAFEDKELRVDVKARLQAIKKAAGTIIRLKGRKDVWATLRVLAPAGARHIDDVSGYEYLVQLVDRVDRADAAIRSGKGKDRLGSSLGRASPRLLCAVLVVKALHLADGRSPSEKNNRALRLCDALWRAAGGAEVGGPATDTGGGEAGGAGAWPRNIREAKLSKIRCNSEEWDRADTMAASAILSARMTAAACLQPLLQK
jgi:hypothetical protein